MHPWLARVGLKPVTTAGTEIPAAASFVDAVRQGLVPGAAIMAVYENDSKTHAAVHIEVEVERPQDLAHPIRAIEPVAVIFATLDARPAVLALREDFPGTPHQNAMPADAPKSLCIDNRPWAEAKLTHTPRELGRQIQLWLSKAANGELHDASLPPEPFYFPDLHTIILPAAAVAPGGDQLQLTGYVREENPRVILTETGASRSGRGAFTVLRFDAEPRAIGPMRHAPQTLGALADELKQRGVDLMAALKAQLGKWSGRNNTEGARLQKMLLLLIGFPGTDERGQATMDVRAFVTVDTAGRIGEQLGVLALDAGRVVGAPPSYVQLIGVANAEAPAQIVIGPASVHLTFDRAIAGRIAGRSDVDTRRALLIGAGSIGSQIALNLAREGRFSWSVVDGDTLLPHNMARHALHASDAGALKAPALARQLTALLGESCEGIFADILAPGMEKSRVDKALAEAEIIIDASASVAVSRHLADLDSSPARRVCAFFNPAGTSAVVLAEPTDRSVTLHDLEAQYFHLVLTDPRLSGHLQPPPPGVNYSGSCRSLTNRIPASSAALLSACASRGIVRCLEQEHSSINIWTLGSDDSVSSVSKAASASFTHSGEWKVSYSDDLLTELTRMRAERLPNETGGILMGIIDISRRSIHIAHALPAPADSTASTTGFERGVAGLLDETSRVSLSTMHQLKYVGEWHSHPDCASVRPSGTDVSQLLWLASELRDEGLPAIMAIAGEDDQFSIIIGDAALASRYRGAS